MRLWLWDPAVRSFIVAMWYRLNQPILAVRKESADLRSALPSGALLTIVVEAPARGLIEAEWNGEVVRVFVEDVRSRGIRVEIINFE